jgi:ABC-type Fe3+/spermidine/putrescine transport system ATPase subunit
MIIFRSTPTIRDREGGTISTESTAESFLALDGITKRFGSFKAVDNLSLDIRHGEVFALLGPSGCGKTTTLRQIAGLDQPDEGVIRLRDTVLVSTAENIFVPPQKRNMGMVFQSYAIWPHLSVFEIIAYPLRVRHRPNDEIDEAVGQIIQQVGLAGMEARSSRTLSGGQQQRVALARALVYKPDVLLLDEPFSNLDVKLREQMRVELKLLQREVGVSVILVTHDQVEALTLSDRVAVMRDGRVEQVGTPLELYEEPGTPFVRDFIGQTTTFTAQIESTDGDAIKVTIGEGGGSLVSRRSRLDGAGAAEAVLACVRPERITVRPASGASKENEVRATVKALLYHGERYECWLTLGGQEIMIFAPREPWLREGEAVYLHVPGEALTLWPN